MKNKILGIFVCILLLLTILSTMGTARFDTLSTPQISSEEFHQPYQGCYLNQRNNYELSPIPLQHGDIIDQFMVDPTNFGWLVFLLQWVAQGFTPNMSILTRVEIELFKIGNPPPDSQIYIGLWDGLYGEELAYTMFTGNDFPGTRKWFTFDFEDLIVEPGRTYYIVCLSDVLSFDYGYYWFAVNNNPYPRGDAWYSIFGYEWFPLDDPPEHPKTDCVFKTYGIDKSVMKWTFLWGSISNQTSIADYIILKAKDLRGLQMFPFATIRYTDNEKVTIHNQFFGFVNNERVFGLFRAHI